MRRAFSCAMVALATTFSGSLFNIAEAAQTGDQETVFVFEMIRHGARSHYEDNVDSKQFFGVGKGHLTRLGRQETS